MAPSTLQSRSTPKTAALSRFGRKSHELRPLPVRVLLLVLMVGRWMAGRALAASLSERRSSDEHREAVSAGGAVTLSLTQQHGAVTLAVRDTGVGILADALPHVFERFYRADSARSRSQDGAGLGLSLVKWIAESHDGTIDVASRQGCGATFTVMLPIPA